MILSHKSMKSTIFTSVNSIVFVHTEIFRSVCQILGMRYMSTTILPYWVYDVCLATFQLIGYTMLFYSYSTLLGIRCYFTVIPRYWVYGVILQSFHIRCLSTTIPPYWVYDVCLQTCQFIGYAMIFRSHSTLLGIPCFVYNDSTLFGIRWFVYNDSTLLSIRCFSTVFPPY